MGVVGNILYFEYRSNYSKRKKILQEQLTKLLLPLYYALEEDDLLWLMHTSNDIFGDPVSHISEMPSRLGKELREIIKNNIYLADDELHEACLNFMKWAYSGEDQNTRFDKFVAGKLDDGDTLARFQKIVKMKYDNARKKYLSLK